MGKAPRLMLFWNPIDARRPAKGHIRAGNRARDTAIRHKVCGGIQFRGFAVISPTFREFPPACPRPRLRY